MTDEKLQQALDQHDLDELRVISTHDGFWIERERDNQVGEKLWQWDVEYDGPPFRTIQTLFEELGYDVEVL